MILLSGFHALHARAVERAAALLAAAPSALQTWAGPHLDAHLTRARSVLRRMSKHATALLAVARLVLLGASILGAAATQAALRPHFATDGSIDRLCDVLVNVGSAAPNAGP